MHNEFWLILIVIAICSWLWYEVREADTDIASLLPDAQLFPYLNEYYSTLSGKEVRMGLWGADGMDGWACEIDGGDCTFRMGLGDTPWQAYVDACNSIERLGTVA